MITTDEDEKKKATKCSLITFKIHHSKLTAGNYV